MLAPSRAPRGRPRWHAPPSAIATPKAATAKSDRTRTRGDTRPFAGALVYRALKDTDTDLPARSCTDCFFVLSMRSNTVASLFPAVIGTSVSCPAETVIPAPRRCRTSDSDLRRRGASPARWRGQQRGSSLSPATMDTVFGMRTSVAQVEHERVRLVVEREGPVRIRIGSGDAVDRHVDTVRRAQEREGHGPLNGRLARGRHNHGDGNRPG